MPPHHAVRIRQQRLECFETSEPRNGCPRRRSNSWAQRDLALFWVAELCGTKAGRLAQARKTMFLLAGVTALHNTNLSPRSHPRYIGIIANVISFVRWSLIHLRPFPYARRSLLLACKYVSSSHHVLPPFDDIGHGYDRLSVDVAASTPSIVTLLLYYSIVQDAEAGTEYMCELQGRWSRCAAVNPRPINTRQNAMSEGLTSQHIRMPAASCTCVHCSASSSNLLLTILLLLQVVYRIKRGC